MICLDFPDFLVILKKQTNKQNETKQNKTKKQ